MIMPIPPMAPTAGRISWSPRCRKATSSQVRARRRGRRSRPRAPRSPISSVPASAMWVTMKPRGHEEEDREEQAELDPAPGDPHRVPDHRSSRIRTRPIVSSSPKLSATGRSMRCPLTYVPFVLPWSSTNQLRPRNVSMAWLALTKSSSTKIVLFTLRPIELIGPRAMVVPPAARPPATRAPRAARSPSARRSAPPRRCAGRGGASRRIA